MDTENSEKNNSNNRINWFTKHVDTVIILGAVVTSLLWMNSQSNAINERFVSHEKNMDTRFSSFEKNMDARFSIVDSRFSNVEKDIAVIKAVMVMKNMMPSELCKKEEK